MKGFIYIIHVMHNSGLNYTHGIAFTTKELATKRAFEIKQESQVAECVIEEIPLKDTL